MVEKKLNERTNRMVLDTEQNEQWRQAYYRYAEKNVSEEKDAILRAIHAKNLGPLNILSTKQVSEYFKCSLTTAWMFMRSGIIPSFQLGRRWYTHDYVIDTIEEKAKELTERGYNSRSWPRMVWKSDKGSSW